VKYISLFMVILLVLQWQTSVDCRHSNPSDLLQYLIWALNVQLFLIVWLSRYWCQ